MQSQALCTPYFYANYFSRGFGQLLAVFHLQATAFQLLLSPSDLLLPELHRPTAGIHPKGGVLLFVGELPPALPTGIEPV